MSRLYEPQSGTLYFDDERYPSLDADWLRQQVGVVSQEPILFAATIEENIRYGKLDASYEEVEAASRAAAREAASTSS